MAKAKVFAAVTTIAALAAVAACTVHQTEPPPLTGPSTFATALQVTATPDSISQDGSSQSAIKISASGPNGQPLSGLALRVDMSVGGTLQDFGTLSARNIVTTSSGTATVVYTAPAPSPANVAGSGTVVNIVATPTGTGFSGLEAMEAAIRLVPPGVIQAPPNTPTAAFTTAPSSPAANSPVVFDASTSCAGQLSGVGGACPSGVGSIIGYKWDFGDGGTGSGVSATHSFASAITYVVTLTVTNSSGLSASVSHAVTMGTGQAPSAAFVVSPTAPNVGQSVLFNGSGSKPGPGHTIVTWAWDFGDGHTSSSGSVTATNAFANPGTYNVVLVVTDETGQTGSATQSVNVGSGNPTGTFTFVAAAGTPPGHTMNFDASGSTAVPPATISTYAWNWGDGTSTAASASATTSHAFTATGSYSVRLTVTDSLGRSSSFTTSVSVP